MKLTDIVENIGSRVFEFLPLLDNEEAKILVEIEDLVYDTKYIKFDVVALQKAE